MFAASKTNSASVGGYQISRSLRFNKDDGPYLNRTPASAGTRTTWTFSTWLKISSTGNELHIFDAVNDFFCIYGSGQLVLYDGSNAPNAEVLKTTQLFRDFSAWYHIVLVWDTTQATSSNRVKLYVNGSQVTAFAATTYPALNATLAFNNNVQQRIGEYGGGGNFYFNGYMTEINFIDGTALTPSSFGETNAQTGVWQPKAFAGTYGTNGFYLNFSDNSNTTAATLGKDYSGNGNNWTPNNFSVTAGAGNDSLVDSPTSYGVDTGVGGSVRGNYATWNPIASSSYATLSNGNLDALGNTAADNGCLLATIGNSSGKWYWEETIGTVVSSYPRMGAMQAPAANGIYPGTASASAGYLPNGVVQKNNSNVTTVATFTTGDVIGFALDLDNLTIAFYKNNTLQYTVTGLTAGTYFLGAGQYNGSTSSANFGQRPFAYTAPSGFKALNTQNLPTPTIGATTATQAGKFFNPVLYTGNGGSQSITGIGFQPDLVWVKSRSNAYNNLLTDAVRGTSKELVSNATDAETTYGLITSFNSDGFTVNGSTYVGSNGNGSTYVGWSWKANGSGSSNTSGSITSTVSASTTSGFSIVSYTGNGTGGATVGHGLGAKPNIVFYKRRNLASDWLCLQDIAGSMKYGYLNTTAAFGAAGETAPTSSVLFLSSGADSNASGGTYVAYCFTPIAGFSAIGSYTGNGSTDGPFVFTGFRPAFILVKNSTTAGFNWNIFDNSRTPYNIENLLLAANLSNAETTFETLDGLSNGFKIRRSNTAFNGSGDTVIYMAFATAPFKYSLAR